MAVRFKQVRFVLLVLCFSSDLVGTPGKAINWQHPLFLEAIALLQAERSLTLGTIAGGRLTTESNVPVSVTDRIGQSTLYYTPYIGSKITLYNGASWQIYGFSELSIAVPSGSVGNVFDVFVYANSGMPTLELQSWADEITRSVALSYVDGIRVKGTDTTRRYVGTIALSGSGTTEDSEPRRLVWNLFNQVERYFFRVDTSSHSYNGGSRAFNGGTGKAVEFVTGEETPFSAAINYSVNNPSSGIASAIAISSEKSCATFNGQSQYRRIGLGARQTPHHEWSYPGYNYLCVVQSTDSSGSATFNFYAILGEVLM